MFKRMPKERQLRVIKGKARLLNLVPGYLIHKKVTLI